VLYFTLSLLSPILRCPDFHCHPCFSVRTYSYGYLSIVIYDLLKQSVPSRWSDESHILCRQSQLLFTSDVAHFRSKHEGRFWFCLTKSCLKVLWHCLFSLLCLNVDPFIVLELFIWFFPSQCFHRQSPTYVLGGQFFTSSNSCARPKMLNLGSACSENCTLYAFLVAFVAGF